MHITLLFGIFPPDRYDYFVEASKGNTQYAADALQKSIITGLAFAREPVSIINLPYIGSFPLRYSKLIIKSFKFEYEIAGKILKGNNIGFLNLMGYKFWSRYIQAKKALFHHQKLISDDEVIVIYAVGTPFLKATADFKKRFPKTKIILVVPDLPEFMSSNKNLIRRVVEKFNILILNNLYKSVDGFVLLTKHMVDRLPVANKPWTVVEGIFNPTDLIDNNEYKSTHRYILYTGTLEYRYGIMNLVKAFADIKLDNIQLIICGDGDAKGEILDYAKKDSRIIYKGLIKRNEALKLQQGATLLVNPRTPEGEFTKYSFPSKTMEYLGSGVPTLLYRLPGIPDEYYDYCFNLSDLSISALSAELYKIMNMDAAELQSIGQRAKQFILEQKNPQVQTKKILDLIHSIQ